MTRNPNDRLLLAALVGVLAAVLVPFTVEAATANWIDDITALVKDHQDLAKLNGRERSYDDYLGELAIVRMALNRGDEKSVYMAMNEFMDMLETSANGRGSIPVWSAKEIFDFCGIVTPVKYHDAPGSVPISVEIGFSLHLL